MTSLRQIEANRRNAQLSTGPVTSEGKERSRRNAVRHGLTAETIISGLEDAADYASFELAITSDFHAELAVERELVLRLASLMWRLRRATAIESGLFQEQVHQLLHDQNESAPDCPQQAADQADCRAILSGGNVRPLQDIADRQPNDAQNSIGVEADGNRDLTRAFTRLTSLPTYPLDRLSRYEAALWRQARQTLNALDALTGRRPRHHTYSRFQR